MFCGIVEMFQTGCEISNNVTVYLEFIIVALGISTAAFFYFRERKDQEGPKQLAKQQKEIIDKLEKISFHEEVLKKRKIMEGLEAIHSEILTIEDSVKDILSVSANPDYLNKLKKIIVNDPFDQINRGTVWSYSIEVKGYNLIRILYPKFTKDFIKMIKDMEYHFPIDLRNDLWRMTQLLEQYFDYREGYPRLISSCKYIKESMPEIALQLHIIKRDLDEFVKFKYPSEKE